MPDADYTEATGGRGFALNLGNTVAGMIGAPQIAPNVERATQALENLSRQTMIALSADVPGRVSNFLLEQFQGMAIQPNSLLQGEDRARERAQQTRDFVAQQLDLNREALQFELDPRTRVETQINTQRLEALLAEWDIVANSFTERGGSRPRQTGVPTGPPGGRPQEGAPPEGIDPAVWGVMTPEERALFQ